MSASAEELSAQAESLKEIVADFSTDEKWILQNQIYSKTYILE
jgi:hypothetical protein